LVSLSAPAEAPVPAVVSAAPAAATSWEASTIDQRMAARVVAVSIATLPLLRPGLAGAVTPADLTIAAAVLAVALWLGSGHLRMRVPLAFSVALIVAGGQVAAIVGDHATIGAIAIAQDLLLFAWCVAIANICRTPETLAIVVRGWAWSSVAVAGLMVIAALTGSTALAGQEVEGGRAALMFANPNQAGGYFAASLMVVLCSGVIRHRSLKVVAVLLLSSATLLAASNAAIGGTLLGLVVAGILTIAQRRGALIAIAVGAITAAVLTAGAVAFVQLDAVEAARQSDIRLLQNTIGRSEESAGDRLGRFEQLRDLYLVQPLLGYGPAATKAVLDDGPFNDAKGAHNDYAAAFVERGVIGAIGLVLLIGSLIGMTASFASRSLEDGFSEAIPSPQFLVGALVAVAVSSLTHEVLHFRYVWALFGLTACLHLWGRNAEGRRTVTGRGRSARAEVA
jgi:O-antigen ligase